MGVELPTLLPWAVFALLACACAIGMLVCVATAVGDHARAHDLRVRVARLQIERKRRIRQLERQRFGGSSEDEEIIEVDVID